MKKTTRETELERDALQEDLGMLAMGPRHRLPGERGFLVLVFENCISSIFSRTARLRSSADEVFLCDPGRQQAPRLPTTGMAAAGHPRGHALRVRHSRSARASDTHIIVKS